MDVSGVGAGPPAADFNRALRALGHTATSSSTAKSTSDMFVSVLQALSEVEMTALLAMVGRPESAQQAGRLDDLLRAAVAAIAEGDSNLAMVHLSEFAAISPKRAETLASLSSLSTLRNPVEQLVSRLNSAARMQAETQLAQATKLMDTIGDQNVIAREIRAENLIMVAGRLLDAGGYANCVWSAELSQLVIDPRLWAPSAVPVPAQVKNAKERGTAREAGIFAGLSAATRIVWAKVQLKARTRRLWFRAPLLVLFLAWLFLGIGGGVFSMLIRTYWPLILPASLVSDAFALWALGFLLLVAVGFYARIRGARF